MGSAHPEFLSLHTYVKHEAFEIDGYHTHDPPIHLICGEMVVYLHFKLWPYQHPHTPFLSETRYERVVITMRKEAEKKNDMHCMTSV